MKTYFSESVKKSALKKAKEFDSVSRIRQVAPRTTIIQNQTFEQNFTEQKRTSNVEAFRQFTTKILPQMELSIEQQLLRAQIQKFNNPSLEKMIISAYQNRMITLFDQQKSMDNIDDVEELFSTLPKNTYDIYSPVSIKDHCEDDIGLYSVFDLKDVEKYYSGGVYGPYMKQEFIYTQKLGVMCIEEGVKLTTALARLNNGPANLQRLKSANPSQIQQLLEDEDYYFQIFHDFSISLIEASEKFRNSEKLQRLFSTPAIFDFLVSLYIQQLKNTKLIDSLISKESRSKIMVETLQQIFDKIELKYIISSDVKQFLKELKSLEINNETIDLQSYIKKPFNLPENLQKYSLKNFVGFNSGLIIHGDQGTGKSGLMLYTSLWAHKNDWIVINIPNCYDMTQRDGVIHRHHETGLFLQYEQTVEYLKSIKTANLENLEKIKFNISIYGKMGHSGVHQNDLNPTPNFYDPERKVYWKEHEKFYYPEEQKLLEEEDRLMNELTLGKTLKEPKNLLEVIDFGIENPEQSICALAELMEQLYNMENNRLLICVDQFNWLYKPSVFKSFRYANDKFLNGHIPPYHMALCRQFMHLDGHKIKNGFKLMSTSVEKLHKHEVGPKQLMMPLTGYDVKLNGLRLDDYRNMLEYLFQNNLWKPSDNEQYAHQQFWMENQGNWSQTLKSIIYNMRE